MLAYESSIISFISLYMTFVGEIYVSSAVSATPRPYGQLVCEGRALYISKIITNNQNTISSKRINKRMLMINIIIISFLPWP